MRVRSQPVFSTMNLFRCNTVIRAEQRRYFWKQPAPSTLLSLQRIKQDDIQLALSISQYTESSDPYPFHDLDGLMKTDTFSSVDGGSGRSTGLFLDEVVSSISNSLATD